MPRPSNHNRAGRATTPRRARSSPPSPTRPAATWSRRSPTRGGATATGLAAELPISRQAVAKHLATLGRAGLVSQSRHGREHRFELDPRPLADAAAWLTTVGAEWDTRLADLQRLLKRREPGRRL